MFKSRDRGSIVQAQQGHRTIWIKSFFCSFIGNLLFIAIALNALHIMERLIGSGILNISLFLSLLVAALVFCSFFCMLLSEILSNMIIKKEAASYFKFIKISIMADAFWSLFYIILLFLVHPILAITTICGVVFVMLYAYIKRVTMDKSIRDATIFDTIKSKWHYPIQHALALVMICLIINFSLQLICGMLYAYFQYSLLIKSIGISSGNYEISNSSKFYIFLKEFMSISIKILIYTIFIGIAAYIIVTTKSTELSTGGMIFGAILTARLMISADNYMTIAHKI